MTRVIKFRAFVKEPRALGWPIERKIYLVDRLEAHTSNSMDCFRTVDITDPDGDSVADDLGPEDVVLMQFTGLLDKHGTEIYEGDVVMAGFNSPSAPPDGTVMGEVKFQGAAFIVDHRYLSKSEELEVIGNIYETPELLKTEDE